MLKVSVLNLRGPAALNRQEIYAFTFSRGRTPTARRKTFTPASSRLFLFHTVNVETLCFCSAAQCERTHCVCQFALATRRVSPGKHCFVCLCSVEAEPVWVGPATSQKRFSFARWFQFRGVKLKHSKFHFVHSSKNRRMFQI